MGELNFSISYFNFHVVDKRLWA